MKFLSVVLFLDVPGEPDRFRPTKVTENTVSLSWEEPLDDGGSAITGYKLERRDASKRNWISVGNFTDMEATVTGLTENVAYSFRVAAENEIGMGPYAELAEPVTPKSQHSK